MEKIEIGQFAFVAIMVLVFVLGYGFASMVNEGKEKEVQKKRDYKDPGKLPNEPDGMWVGTPGENGNYCIMLPVERDDEEYAGAGGLNRCFGYDTREEAVEDYLKYHLKK